MGQRCHGRTEQAEFFFIDRRSDAQLNTRLVIGVLKVHTATSSSTHVAGYFTTILVQFLVLLTEPERRAPTRKTEYKFRVFVILWLNETGDSHGGTGNEFRYPTSDTLLCSSTTMPSEEQAATSSHMMKTTKRGRPFLKDTLDLFATLIVSLQLGPHKQFFRTFSNSFST